MKTRKRIFEMLALSLACIGLTAGTSRASISITEGNDPQTNEVNIHLDGGAAGIIVTGTANTTLGLYTVKFKSSQTLLVGSNGQGQAFIEATNGIGGSQIGLTNGSIELASDSPTSTFEDFILNLSNGGSFSADGVEITVFGTSTTQTYTDDSLGNGQNFYTIVASGEEIKSISFVATAGALDGFDALQQPRISFAEATAVPEPSTLIGGSISALCLLGFGLHRRRKSS